MLLLWSSLFATAEPNDRCDCNRRYDTSSKAYPDLLFGGMPDCVFAACSVELPSFSPVAVGCDNDDEYVIFDVSTDVIVTSDVISV